MKNIWRYFLLICIFSYMMNVCSFASNSTVGSVDNWSISGKSVTVSGYGENVSIFLLNPGKTVSDLSAAEDIDAFNEIVNYTNVVNVDEYGEYSVTFDINTGYEAAAFLLYVKDKTGEFSAAVNYAGLDATLIYVSKNAQSGGDGSQEKPFGTVEEARDYIRTMDTTLPIEVVVSEGVYTLTETIEFTQEDSGSADAPITYRAADGEKVIFSGAKKIDISNTVKKVNDGNILGRVSAEAAKNLVEIDLAANSIPQTIADYLANHTAGNVAKTVGIYLNDERQTVARWPNSGYKMLRNVDNSNLTLKITDSEDRLSKWANATDMYIEGYFANDWYQQWTKVSTVDAESNVITLSYSPSYGLLNSGRAAVVNLLEEIDVPGEWYIDADSMKLYYYPPHELTDSDKLEICTLAKNFITIKDGCEYLNFEGFTFEKNANSPTDTTSTTVGGNGIFIRESSNISVKNCVLKHTGMDSIYLLFSSSIDIDSCTIYDTGLRGIYIKRCGDVSTLEGCDITISNNYISEAGRDYGKSSGAGIFIDNTDDSVGVTIKNNTICNMKSSAIRYGGNLHKIENNEIYNCVMDTADAGAIYSGRSFVQYGTVIKNNHFHKIGAGLTTSGAGAVFWDDAHSGNSFIGNIVDLSNVDNAQGIRLAGGRDNLVTGNIFVNGDAIKGGDRTINPTAEEYDPNDTDNFYNGTYFQSFINAAKGAASGVTNAYYITDEDWNSAYKTKFKNIMVNFNELRNQQKYTSVNTIKGNILTGNISLTEKLTNDSIVEDNRTPDDMTVFVDAEGGNYMLTEEYFNTVSAISKDFLHEGYSGTFGLEREFSPNDYDTEFSLIYPFDSSVIYGEDVTLKWGKSYFANTYKYEVSDTQDFSNKVASGETHENSVVLSGLEKNKTYYWRVAGYNNSSYLDYEITCEDVYSFTFNSGIYVSGLEFDEYRDTINCTLINDTAADKNNIIFVAALKDVNGKLIEVKITDGEAKISESTTTPVDAEFAKSGDLIELFVLESFDNLHPNAIKYKFKC